MEKQKQKTGLCKMISAWIICIVLVMSVPIQAQNLLTGWDDTAGTPYDAGWRVDESISIAWGNLAASSGNRYRGEGMGDLEVQPSIFILLTICWQQSLFQKNL